MNSKNIHWNDWFFSIKSICDNRTSFIDMFLTAILFFTAINLFIYHPLERLNDYQLITDQGVSSEMLGTMILLGVFFNSLRLFIKFHWWLLYTVIVKCYLLFLFLVIMYSMFSLKIPSLSIYFVCFVTYLSFDNILKT